jgi:hypothetical protein
MERTNLRALRLADIGGAPVDLVTLDLSFISLLKVVDAVRSAALCCAVHANRLLRRRVGPARPRSAASLGTGASLLRTCPHLPLTPPPLKAGL